MEGAKKKIKRERENNTDCIKGGGVNKWISLIEVSLISIIIDFRRKKKEGRKKIIIIILGWYSI